MKVKQPEDASTIEFRSRHHKCPIEIAWTFECPFRMCHGWWPPLQEQHDFLFVRFLKFPLALAWIYMNKLPLLRAFTSTCEACRGNHKLEYWTVFPRETKNVLINTARGHICQCFLARHILWRRSCSIFQVCTLPPIHPFLRKMVWANLFAIILSLSQGTRAKARHTRAHAFDGMSVLEHNNHFRGNLACRHFFSWHPRH